jgi:hypothetical protein
LQKQQRGFARLLVFGEVALNAFLLFAAEHLAVGHHLVRITSTRSRSPGSRVQTLRELVAQRVAGIDLRRVESVQQQVHLAEQIRQRLRLAPDETLFLQDLAVGHGLHLLAQMIERLDEKPARAARRVEHHFAQARVGDRDHEAHHRARRVELAGIARGIAHLAQHRFVERAKGSPNYEVRVPKFSRFDIRHSKFVIPSAHHPVLHPAKHRGDHVAPIVAIGTGELAQITKEALASLGGTPQGVGQHSLFVVDKGQKFIARDALRICRPIAPAIRRFDGRLELLPRELRLLRALQLQIIKEFEEHNPREHRQPVQVAIQPLVLAHDVACGFQE